MPVSFSLVIPVILAIASFISVILPSVLTVTRGSRLASIKLLAYCDFCVFVVSTLFVLKFFCKRQFAFINADGILKVQAKGLRSGVAQSIEVKPQYGLTDEEVEHMLADSLTHAKTDIQVRAIVEAKTEAQQLIDTTKNFIKKNAGFLSKEEIVATENGIRELESVLLSADKDLIHSKIEALNEISRPYAERLMDAAISSSLSGKKID